jgi:hypothetical protein
METRECGHKELCRVSGRGKQSIRQDVCMKCCTEDVLASMKLRTAVCENQAPMGNDKGSRYVDVPSKEWSPRHRGHGKVQKREGQTRRQEIKQTMWS